MQGPVHIVKSKSLLVCKIDSQYDRKSKMSRLTWQAVDARGLIALFEDT